MTNESEQLPAGDAPPVHFEFSTAYVVGLIGFSVGLGFYGLLFVLMLVAWCLRAPSAPTATEGSAIYYAAVLHSIPLCLWLAYRKKIARLPSHWKWVLALGAWLLILVTLTIMAVTLGV